MRVKVLRIAVFSLFFCQLVVADPIQDALTSIDALVKEQKNLQALIQIEKFFLQNLALFQDKSISLDTSKKIQKNFVDRTRLMITLVRTQEGSSQLERYKIGYNQLDEAEKLVSNSPKLISLLKTLRIILLDSENRTRVKNLMTDAQAFLADFQYYSAATRYGEGLELGKEAFESSTFAPATIDATAREKSRVATSIQRISVLEKNIKIALQAVQYDLLIKNIASASPQDSNIILLKDSISEALALLRLYRDAGISVGRLSALLPKESKIPYQYEYLTSLFYLIRGRPDEKSEFIKVAKEAYKPEGLEGVMLDLLRFTLTSLRETTEKTIDWAIKKALQAIKELNFSEATMLFTSAMNLTRIADFATPAWEEIGKGDFVPTLTEYQLAITKELAAVRRMSLAGLISGAYSRLTDEQRIAKIQVSLITTKIKDAREGIVKKNTSNYIITNEGLKELLAWLQSLPSRLRSLQEDWIRIKKNAEDTNALIKDASKQPSSNSQSAIQNVDLIKFCEQDINKNAQNSKDNYLAIWLSILANDVPEINKELLIHNKVIQEGIKVKQGQLSARQERRVAGFFDSSATKAALIWAKESETVREFQLTQMKLEQGLSGFEYVNNTEWKNYKTTLTSIASRTKELLSSLQSNLAEANNIIKKAADKLASAIQFFDDARKNLNDSQKYIDSGFGFELVYTSFDAASKNIELAYKNIIDASNMDFDEATWIKYQNIYDDLSLQLTQSRREYSYAQALGYLERGQVFYAQGLYEQAATALNMGQESWRRENETDQEQILYWQNLVRQAGNITNKRVLRPNDPLYYEISNYSSQSRQLYDKAILLAKSGKKAASTQVLLEAQEKNNYILSIFPLNADAGLLRLRIQKTIDTQAYAKNLQNMIKQAVELLASDPETAYSRISDLYQMESTNKTIAAALAEAEIKTGKRRPPTQKKDVDTLAVSIKQAAAMYKTDITGAKALVNSALSLDPGNKDALKLLGIILQYESRTTGPVLRLTEQAILDNALFTFSSQQYNQSRDILNPLLASARTKTREVVKLDSNLKALGY